VERGWERAEALVNFFATAKPPGTPDVVYASTVGPGSESKRPCQTVAPLVERLSGHVVFQYVQRFAKPETKALMADVMTRTGTVLVCWEHSKIAECVACLPNAPPTPENWPSDRYDLVWHLHRNGPGWTFFETPQCLLPGDAPVG